MSLSGLILGIMNIVINVALMILFGLVVVWLLSLVKVSVPDNVQRMYMIVVALITIYMFAALIFGLPSWRIIGSNESRVPPVTGTIASPRSIIK